MSGDTLSNALKSVLADSYVLYSKTQNFHWNVSGPLFPQLHLLFETQYTDLATAIDEIAELIRGLGDLTPGKLSSYLDLATIEEGDESLDATSMVKALADDQGKIETTLAKALKAAQDAGDEVVVGAIANRLTVHRKNKWMLSSSI